MSPKDWTQDMRGYGFWSLIGGPLQGAVGVLKVGNTCKIPPNKGGGVLPPYLKFKELFGSFRLPVCHLHLTTW